MHLPARSCSSSPELSQPVLEEILRSYMANSFKNCAGGTVRTFRARAALRRRVELGENTGVAAAAVVLRAPADES